MTAATKDWEPIKSLCLTCKQYTAFAGFKICGDCYDAFRKKNGYN